MGINTYEFGPRTNWPGLYVVSITLDGGLVDELAVRVIEAIPGQPFEFAGMDSAEYGLPLVYLRPDLAAELENSGHISVELGGGFVMESEHETMDDEDVLQGVEARVAAQASDCVEGQDYAILANGRYYYGYAELYDDPDYPEDASVSLYSSPSFDFSGRVHWLNPDGNKWPEFPFGFIEQSVPGQGYTVENAITGEIFGLFQTPEEAEDYYRSEVTPGLNAKPWIIWDRSSGRTYKPIGYSV